jgi:hypothetical protein
VYYLTWDCGVGQAEWKCLDLNDACA